MRLTALIATLAAWAAAPVLAQKSYRVGPGDLLKISVIELEEIDNEYRVDGLGAVNLPYLGRVEVKDKTAVELIALLTEKLKAGFVNDPNVYVDLLEYNYRPISVIGAVNQPGKLAGGARELTLVEAIVQAGGVSERAGDKIFVIRKKPDGGNATWETSYARLMIDGEPHLNIPLYPGDTVNVPVARKIVISVLGEVNKPGQYTFKSGDKVTLLRVIAAAGGFTDYARRNRVAIRRNREGEPGEVKINVRDVASNKREDPPLHDNDIVIVP